MPKCGLSSGLAGSSGDRGRGPAGVHTYLRAAQDTARGTGSCSFVMGLTWQMVPKWPLAGQLAGTDFGNTCAPARRTKLFLFSPEPNHFTIIVRYAVHTGVKGLYVHSS